jgi:hypothetical protein
MKDLFLSLLRPITWSLVIFQCKCGNMHLHPFLYRLLRLDHRLSKGQSTEKFILLYRKACFVSSGSPIASGKYKGIVDSLNRDGYARVSRTNYNFRIDCNLDSFQYRSTNGNMYAPRAQIHEMIKNGELAGGRIDVPIESYNQSFWFNSLIKDPLFSQIAALYFQSKPYFVYSAMWELLSIPDSTTIPISAQHFHWDWDVINPLNFFILCTDTRECDGPLEYINGSHKRLPAAHDGPWSDELIESLGLAPNISRLTGSKGDIFVCDNSGLHRDSLPSKIGYKRWLQLTFSPCRIRPVYSSLYLNNHLT